MSLAEREVLLALLKLTKDGLASKELIIKDAKVATSVAEELFKKFTHHELIEVKGKLVKTTPEKRIKMAVYAIQKGADFERVCKFLDWKEFENIAATIFKTNGYDIKRNFHFKNEKRWEIDLIAIKKPLIICVDCKHWQHGWSKSAIIKATENQIERTKALAEALPKICKEIKLENWSQATFIPTVLSLISGPLKFHKNTPIVPILQLQNFISELPANITLLTHFSKNITNKNKKLTEFQQLNQKEK
ncbi:MAG: NERD domain-containing protein [Candidatus Bathyarchaeia archaeon]